MLEAATVILLIAIAVMLKQPPQSFAPSLAGIPDGFFDEPEEKEWEKNLMFKKGGGSAPAPDPQIGEAALKNAKTGEAWLDFAKKQFDVQNRRQRGIDEMTQEIGEQQLETQDQANRWAREDRSRWEEVFKPIEDQLVEDAVDWDSEARQTERAAEAKSQVMSNAADAREQSARRMASMGIDPRSGRAQGVERTQDTQTALASAGAQNNARKQVRSEGRAMRADAANMGRGLPSQAASAASLGLTAGNSAQGLELNAAQNARANTGIVGQGFQGAMQGYNNQANTLNQQYQNQLQAWSANQQAAGDFWGGIGQVAGTAGAMYMASSEESKTKKQPIKSSALEAIKGLPIEAWEYKDGAKREVSGEVLPKDDKRHVGTYAEDFARETGIGDGKTIPVQDAIGVTMKAVQELDKKVERLALPKHESIKKRQAS